MIKATKQPKAYILGIIDGIILLGTLWWLNQLWAYQQWHMITISGIAMLAFAKVLLLSSMRKEM